MILLLAGAAAFAQSPAPLPDNPAAIVEKPLTPPTNDVPDEQPSPQHAWVPGHWRWGQGSYVWVAGRWQIPPVQNVTWAAPQWEQRGGGYVLRDGFWQQNGVTGDPSISAPPVETTTTQMPPPPRPEFIPEQPSAAYAWQPGFWNWSGNQFVWENGKWELPPRQNLAWVPTHWETRGDRYVLTSGYWRENGLTVGAVSPAPTMVSAPTTVTLAQPAPQVVVVTPPPPRPTEVVYGRPSPTHEWVPGYWAWRSGRYVWIAGHWERPPHEHRNWVEPRWEPRGGRYVFVEGHWH